MTILLTFIKKLSKIIIKKKIIFIYYLNTGHQINEENIQKLRKKIPFFRLNEYSLISRIFYLLTQ